MPRPVTTSLLLALGFGLGWLGAMGWGGTGEPGSRPRPPDVGATFGPSAARVNVREHGAVGDGTTDDTAAVSRAISGAAVGTEVFFPPGTYVVNDLVIEGRKGLAFAGAGEDSIVKRTTTDNIITCTRCEDIAITGLSFDFNGGLQFGGVRFYSSKRVRIEGNRFFDSRRQPVGETDRYAIVFGHGEEPSEDVQILDNEIRDLQIEVDHARRVEIVGNTSINAVKTAAIGGFTIGHGSIIEDYLVADNTIVDPYGHGIVFLLDPPESSNCVFRRISIRNNEIRRTVPATGWDFFLGTANNSVPTSGNVFEDIAIVGNRIDVESSVPAGSLLGSVFANSSETANLVFERLEIRGNRFELGGKQRSDAWAIELRRPVDSIVTENVIVDAGRGITLLGGEGNRVERNRVNGSS